MPDNHSDSEDHENVSSESEFISIGSSPSSLNCQTSPNSLNFKSMANMGQDSSSPPSILSIHGSSPGDILMNGGSPNSSLTSVQAALAALKAGQMSLKQVSLEFVFSPGTNIFVKKFKLFMSNCQSYRANFGLIYTQIVDFVP